MDNRTGFYRPVMTMYPTQHDKMGVAFASWFVSVFFTDPAHPFNMDSDMMEFVLGVNQ